MDFSGLDHERQTVILLINVQMPTIVHLTFMSRINFCSAEFSMKIVTLGPGFLEADLLLCSLRSEAAILASWCREQANSFPVQRHSSSGGNLPRRYQ